MVPGPGVCPLRFGVRILYMYYVKITLHICSEDNSYIPLPEGTVIPLPEGTVKITLKSSNPTWLALTVAGASMRDGFHANLLMRSGRPIRIHQLEHGIDK